MNERIVKLFMQSVDSNYIPLPIEDHIPSWTEKFAESIVRQCGFELVDESLQYNSPLIQEFTVKVANRIKKHFGVEE